MGRTEALKQAQKRYERKNIVQVRLKLNNVTDADVLAKLDCVGNRQGYIKELIRADIARKRGSK